MIRYVVTCQDAAGHSIRVAVRAKTDEKACDVALELLNSWKAVRALPARSTEVVVPVEEASPPPKETEEPSRGLRIISKAGPRDWINPRARATTAVGRALLAAAREERAA